MKTLYIMRHAKSNWDELFNSDLERGLKKRGYEDSIKVAKELRKKAILPDLIVSSPAKRALITAQIISAFLRYEIENIKISKNLYFGGVDVIINIIKATSNNIEKLMIIGHNPELTDLINKISNFNLDNLPTAGIVEIIFDINSWVNLQKGKKSLFIKPSLIKDII